MNVDVVIHRVNTVSALAEVSTAYGAEIDLRAEGNEIVLNHEPFCGGEHFGRWLEHYSHRLLVLNVKETGIESEVLRMVRGHGVQNYFLLDVEFPYIYRASRRGERAIAVRYSEDEPLELVDRYRTFVDWVWIDTNTRLPLDAHTVARLKGMKTCLVCPERWGRPQDIPLYQEQMTALGFVPDAVMTTTGHARRWEEWR